SPRAGDSLSLCPSARSCCTLAAERRLQDASWEKLRALVWANTESLRRFLDDSAASFTGFRYEETKTMQKRHGHKWKEYTQRWCCIPSACPCAALFSSQHAPTFPTTKVAVRLGTRFLRTSFEGGRKTTMAHAMMRKQLAPSTSRGGAFTETPRRFGREKVNVFIDEKKIFSKRCSSGRDGGHNPTCPRATAGSVAHLPTTRPSSATAIVIILIIVGDPLIGRRRRGFGPDHREADIAKAVIWDPSRLSFSRR
ncbi:unnamed protein product, partial [Ixodes pacificus]